MENVSLQARLLELLRQGQDEEQAFVNRLSEAERRETGTPRRWSAKDVIAHINAWRRTMTQELATIRRGEVPPPRSDDEDERNAEIFTENAERSWQEVEGQAQQVFTELSAHVSAMSDTDLEKPHRRGPLWRAVLGNSFMHPQTHLADYYVSRGNLTQATRLQETAAAAISGLDDSPETRGTAIYNLACFYATTAQPDKALVLLREALLLSPNLTDWSKEDPDLVSLHDNPAYQALYQG